MEIFLAVYLISTAASILICHFIAKARGANSIEWAVNAMIFSVLAIPFVFFCKPVKTSWHLMPHSKNHHNQ